ALCGDQSEARLTIPRDRFETIVMLRAAGRKERYRYCSGAQTREESDHVVHAGRVEQQNPISRRALLLQYCGQRQNALLQPAIGDRFADNINVLAVSVSS